MLGFFRLPKLSFTSELSGTITVRTNQSKNDQVRLVIFVLKEPN
ncbi:MAG: hypothetical protein BSOLF_1461 [Candidatus Carbobacillus altaicus]|uniref:Uncharacterized protein n=1 Tax=Candidatus Carbonibacillus altaicus TaxID=2163959 RepID=A0A2R6XZE1_9BACL|nr:MAG: hypothetical protein BSOLF_1461 [Candidatus Carbobacillus altaicus]